MAVETRPVFLLSPPRSGSTLLQRLLSTHPDIATTPEPWLLLPLLQAFRPAAGFAEHDQTLLARALDDFSAALPNGAADMHHAIRDFATGLYAKAGNNAPYFLDKTPRYALVAQQLVQIFPAARFVFLFRDPVAITQSMNTTWGGGKWVLYRYYADLFDGVLNLANTARALGPRAHIVNYETLLQSPETTCARLTGFLNLPLLPTPLTAPPLVGQMGDPLQAKTIGDAAPDWRQQPLSPPRRRWLGRYLAHLGADSLQTMGYDLPTLLADLRRTPTGGGGVSDLARMGYGQLYRQLNLPMWRAKARRRKAGGVALAYK